MAWVVGLTVLSQAMTAVAFRSWGAVADRFDLRTVMRVSGALFLLTVAAWPFINLLSAKGPCWRSSFWCTRSPAWPRPA